MAPPLDNKYISSPFYYVYILTSGKDRNFYIGYTYDLRKRIVRHESGQVPATKSRLPLKLFFYEAFINKYDALRRERYFKSTKGKQTLYKMLRESLKDNIMSL